MMELIINIVIGCVAREAAIAMVKYIHIYIEASIFLGLLYARSSAFVPLYMQLLLSGCGFQWRPPSRRNCCFCTGSTRH